MSTQLQLPIEYIQQMRELLRDEADRFLQSYHSPRSFGLRINPLKINTSSPSFERIRKLFALEPVPWCPAGFYYRENDRPGKHPYHAAGLYYIQEPSAMSAVELLAPKPGETVLDLAAAPGGKTTHIAGEMQGQGLLIANEIHPARARILSENTERLGLMNTVVTNAAPDELSKRFPEMFDRILLDAPCSGEGMFRKDPEAVAEWSPAHVAMCAGRQADILEHAALMLKSGGTLVYSTCTFNLSENEHTVEAFLRRHPNFEVGRIERLWPHEVRGEGHFVAVLRKREGAPADTARLKQPGRSRGRGAKSGRSGKTGHTADMALFRAFAAESLPRFALGAGEPLRFGGALYWLPHDAGGRFGAEALQGLRVSRPGLHLGEVRKNRIEPAHALALAASADQAAWVRDYPPEAPEIAAFLRGETLPAPGGVSGWGLIAVSGHPLGWGKASGGQIKNHLPKGLRSLG
ncbi:RsmB/NOP family class I SAM-dependent RNA methyltransferase [Paenibacillus tarimensis]